MVWESRMLSLAGKSVTVTGGAGFLGSFVVQELRKRGVRDVFVVRKRDFDLTRPEAAESLYRKAEPDILIHLAATVGGIGANAQNPGLFFGDNLRMGLNVIEAGRQYGKLQKIIIAGTTCSYPKFTPIPFREEDFWNGYPEETNAPYGIAKKALLEMAQAYRAQYGLNSIYLIPANLYGPGDNFDPRSSHVIPALIRKFVQAKQDGCKSVLIWGTGKASREFLYAEDCAEGIIAAAERYEGKEPVNLGTGEEIEIANLVTLIKGLVGYEGNIEWDHSKPDGQPRRRLDTTRAAQEFDFHARTELTAGLRATIEWYISRSKQPTCAVGDGSRERPATGEKLQLHIGCGDRIIPGFINVDVRKLPHVDVVAAADHLPMFGGGTVDLIYSSHVLEHVRRGGEPTVLNEWHRVLRPGGVLRLAVPDFESIVTWYKRSGMLDDIMGLLYGGQNHEHNVHYQTFDFARLSQLLLKAGFREVYRYDWSQTVHKDYDDFSQAYLPHLDKKNGLLMSLNVEATK